MANDNSKDVANLLNKYTDYAHKGTNFVLDSAENINKWYAEQLNKITESDVDTSRIETGIDNSTETNDIANKNKKQISTKVKQYNEIQTSNNNNKNNIIKNDKIQTATKNKNDIDGTVLKKNNSKLKTSKRISTAIKGTKLVNNSTKKMIRTGKNISTGLNENGTNAFKDTSSRIMTKPIKSATNKVVNKTSSKIVKETMKNTKKFSQKIKTKISSNKISKKLDKKVISKTTNAMIKVMKLVARLIENAVKLILSMLPQIAPILIIIVVIVAFCSFFRYWNERRYKKRL